MKVAPKGSMPVTPGVQGEGDESAHPHHLSPGRETLPSVSHCPRRAELQEPRAFPSITPPLPGSELALGARASGWFPQCISVGILNTFWLPRGSQMPSLCHHVAIMAASRGVVLKRPPPIWCPFSLSKARSWGTPSQGPKAEHSRLWLRSPKRAVERSILFVLAP